MIYNNRIKYCRQEHDITQKELGELFGVHETTVSGWENAQDTIPLKKLIKFCNEYNYSLDYVLSLDDNNKRYQKSHLNVNIIGENLRRIRKNRKLTQEQMADILEISQARYSNYENAKFLITTDILYTLCKKLNISADKIIGRIPK